MEMEHSISTQEVLRVNRTKVTHLLKIATGGGEAHKLAIAEAAVLFADAGYRGHDTTTLSDSPYRPDLIVSKTDRFIDGAHRKMRTETYWIEVVDTSMPPRTFVKLPYSLIRIDIGDCTTADERIERIRRAIA